jgi:aspartyl-tRNA synthetase
VAELDAAHTGDEVLLYAWVETVRDHGGVRFLTLRDRSGRLQAVADPEKVTVRPRKEAVVRAHGVVRPRATGREDGALKTGAIELELADLEVLGEPAGDLPFSPADPSTVGEATRLLHRVLELRSPRLQERLRFRAALLSTLRRGLEDEGFAEVETPILTRATPEGARDFLVPSRRGGGAVYALPQSPQLFKQMLMIGGWDRYYQVCRCFRDEDLRADRQPEFTQLDLEMSFAGPGAVMALVETLLARVRERFPELPLSSDSPPRLTYEEAMSRYGTDRPDTRFGLEVQDLSESWDAPGLARLRELAGEGAALRAFRAPGMDTLGRKALTRLQARGESGGHQAQWVRHREGAYASSARALLGAEGMASVFQAAGAEPGDLVFFKAAPGLAAARDLGEVRLALGEDLVPDDAPHQLLWVTDFPWLERDDGGRWVARHHPFTRPRPEDLAAGRPPGEIRALAYDLVMDGVEIGGGSARIHDAEEQAEMFEKLGLGAEEAERRFGFFLAALRAGTPPHAGLALGVDRLVALLSRADSLREVIAFPKTADGACALTGAPAPAGVEELLDLGLKRVQKGDP